MLCAKMGIDVELMRVSPTIKQESLIKLIKQKNLDLGVSGIFVQFPLPKHLDEKVITNSIDPSKDVDGLHDINLGKLVHNDPSGFVPCTVAGVIQIFDYLQLNVSGKKICIAGRSNIVGKPLALKLINLGATVTVCNSKTPNLKKLVKDSDVFISAIGSPHFFDESYFKKNQYVIDVGINRVDGKVCGDVDYNKVHKKVKFITPVPGGVGVLTVVNVLLNVIRAYDLAHNKE